MSEFRTDEEQAELVKKWWSENGTSIVATVAVVAAGWFGWTKYEENVQQTGEAASAVFNQLSEKVALPASEQTDALKVEMQALAEQLKTEYADTAYADFGRLFSARFAADEGDFAAAATELETLLADVDEGPIKYTAQGRLAAIYVQLEQLDDALTLTETIPDPAYAVQFEDVRGDAFYRQGNYKEAREAYLRANDAAQIIGVRDPSIQRKIDSLVALINTSEDSQSANAEPELDDSSTEEAVKEVVLDVPAEAATAESAEVSDPS